MSLYKLRNSSRMQCGLFLSSLLLATTVYADEPEIDCDNAYKTYEINHCASIELDKSTATMTHYLGTALQHHADDQALVDAIQTAQQRWVDYYEAHCDAIYTQWRGGTIRGVMAISCKDKLTRQRTHEIWENFLTYMDSTPPVLPEPGIDE